MEKLSSMLSARSNQMETLGNLREELVRFINLFQILTYVESRWLVSTAVIHTACFLKVTQYFGVGYQKKDLNLLDQVTVCNKQGVLLDPQF